MGQPLGQPGCPRRLKPGDVRVLVLVVTTLGGRYQAPELRSWGMKWSTAENQWVVNVRASPVGRSLGSRLAGGQWCVEAMADAFETGLRASRVI